MQKFLLIILLAFFANRCAAQSIYPYEEIPLKSPADFKAAEPFAFNAATFLLSNPYNEKDTNRDRALKFLINWAMGDKDYHFELTGVMLDLRDDKELMSMYVPAMVKFCLENKTLGSNTSLIEKAAVKIVLDYSNNPANNFTLKKKTRKKLGVN